MCDPVSALIAASTAVAAVGQGVGAMQQASAYRYQAKVADRNAQLVSNQTAMAQENSRLDALRLGRKVGQTRGAQIAAQAANGVDVGFGNAAQVQADTSMFAREDYNQIYRQDAQNTLGYDISVANYEADASAKRQAASGAIVKGIFDVGSTVLGGATQYSKHQASLQAG